MIDTQQRSLTSRFSRRNDVFGESIRSSLLTLFARLARSYPPTPPLDISSRDGWVFLVLRLPRTTDDPRAAH